MIKYKHIFLLVLLLSSSMAGLRAQNLSVKGTVLDENGQPLIGAGVTSQDGKRGVVTDFDGKYSFPLTSEDKTLTFSYIGYTSLTVAIDSRSTVDVKMSPDMSNVLNDVVVIGYGSTKKSDLTGAVASVKMSDISDAPSVSVDKALQGRVAGMDVMSTSGEPGAGTSIRIRGTRSITASNEPLIVVDGVMDAVSDMNEIDPADIASVNILKDASSTAIYGSRGANGVVMITTKKGSTAKPSVNAKFSYGVSQIARKLDLMNTEEMIAYRNDIAWLDKWTVDKTAIKLPYDIKDYPNDTDWLKEVTRLAQSQTANITLSGKNGGTAYSVFGGINNTEGIIQGSGFLRGSGRLNVSREFTRWLKLGASVSYTCSRENPNKANIGGTNIYTGVVYLAPFIGPYDSVNPLYINGSNINTPRMSIDLTDYRKTRRIGNYVGTVTITPHRSVELKSQNSFNSNITQTFRYDPSSLPARYEGQGGKAYRQTYDKSHFLSENTLTYRNKFAGYHAFEALLGYSASLDNIRVENITADGILDDSLKWNALNAVGSKENYAIDSDLSRIVRHSFFARLNYNYRGRYYITATGRSDGSSNFSANNKWGFFPSGAFKWVISKEKFLRNARWMDNLALRLSAGRSGNDAIAAYRSLGVYSSSTSGSVFNGVQGSDFYPGRLANPDLTWEKTTSYNVGLDFSALKNRLTITVDGYYSRTSDLLLPLKTIQSTGFASRYTNLGLTSNRGVELTLETKNIEKKNFGWTTALTLSHNTQRVEDIGNEEYVSSLDAPLKYMMYGYKKGYPLNSLWGFQYAGTFKSEEEVIRNLKTRSYIGQTTLSGPENASTMLGRAKYVDVDHDGLLSSKDLIYLGNSDPLLYGGFQNTFNIYGLKLGLYFTWSVGGKIYNWSELYMSGSYSTNQYRYMTERWHPTRNPDSDLPRAGIGSSHVPSSLQVHDASYLRLKTASLSYRFDFRGKKSLVKALTVGVSGENIFLVTGYNGFDPDVSTNSESSTLRRVDIGAYPSARTFMLNLNITL